MLTSKQIHPLVKEFEGRSIGITNYKGIIVLKTKEGYTLLQNGKHKVKTVEQVDEFLNKAYDAIKTSIINNQKI